MSQNILINRTRALTTRLNRKSYYDFMLYRGDTSAMLTGNAFNRMMIADFSPKDCFDIKDGRLYSNVTWNEAVNNGVTLKNIGFTGVDNGFIHYDKHAISNEAFLNLFFNSEFTIPADEKRLFLTPVTGNTARFEYPTEAYCDYLTFKGGFYQGFYKLAGNDYQVLPNGPQGEMVMHFVVRPKTDYETPDNIVNNLHPENKGIFFYMGLRGENKFWPYYNTDSSITNTMIIDPNHVDEKNPKAIDYTIPTPDYSEEKEGCEAYMAEEPKNEVCTDYFGDGYMVDPNEYTKVGGKKHTTKVPQEPTIIETIERVETCKSCGPIYKKRTKVIFPEQIKEEEMADCEAYMTDCSDLPPFDDDYMTKDVEIDEAKLINEKTDSDGNPLSETGHYTIESDNNFLLFDRTPEGVTTATYEDGMKVQLKMKKHPDINLFPLMNRTPTGYTTNTIESYLDSIGSINKIDLINDSIANAFALRIRDDGSIGYRLMKRDCDNELRYGIEEEYSKAGMIKSDVWNDIVIRFMYIPEPISKCDKRSRMMKILIYVNGFLKLISKELPSFNFRELDEVPEKQEGVPYNISLGGGTLGLLETITPDYYKVSNHLLPIEKNFCGTFIGDIQKFQIYEGFVDYHSILNYLSKNNI